MFGLPSLTPEGCQLPCFKFKLIYNTASTCDDLVVSAVSPLLSTLTVDLLGLTSLWMTRIFHLAMVARLMMTRLSRLRLRREVLRF
jgi:hypothetical protein